MIHKSTNAKPNYSKGVPMEFGELRRPAKKVFCLEPLFKAAQVLFETWQ